MSAHYDNTEAASKLENGQLLAVLTRIAEALEKQNEQAERQTDALIGVSNRIEDLVPVICGRF